MSDRPDPGALDDAIRRKWALRSNIYKPYPCGVVLNLVIEACLDLTRDKNWHVDDIAQVTLTGHPLLRQRTDRPGVRTGREAQVGAQHSVTVSLIRGRASLAEFTDATVQDAQVRELGSRVTFVDDPSLPVESATIAIAIALRYGDTRVRSIASAKGSLQIPLTDVELEDKFRVLFDARRDCQIGCGVWSVFPTRRMSCARRKRSEPIGNGHDRALLASACSG